MVGEVSGVVGGVSGSGGWSKGVMGGVRGMGGVR